MPYIEAKFYEGRLTDAVSQSLIEELTDALVRVFGENVRDRTWVVLEEIPPSRWGVAGKSGDQVVNASQAQA